MKWHLKIAALCCLLLALAAGALAAEGTLTLPAALTEIEAEAFAGLTEARRIDLPATVTKIGSGAFRDCGRPSDPLRYYFVPAGVSAASDAFEGCRAVLTYDGSELPCLTYSVAEGGATVTGMTGQLAEVVIPDTLAGQPVVAIGNNAFSDRSVMTRVVIPSTVTSIGQNAFRGCRALTDIDLPAGLTSLGSSVFSGCQALKEIDLPAGVTAIPSEAFYGCTSLAEIDLTGVTSLGNSAFRECRALTEVTIPAGITVLPASLFEEATGLAQVRLPATLTTINNYAFWHCRALEEISIPAGVTAIPYAAFSGCSALRRVQLPEGIESISDHAFRECTVLTQINFPAGLASIGQEAFRDSCVGQPDNAIYVLPDTVETFGSNAFYNCGAGLLVEKESDGETFVKENGYTFAYDAEDGFRYQYKKSDDVYTLYLTGYKGAGGSISIPVGPTVVGESAFEENTALTGVTIPAGVTLVDRNAFRKCANLESVAMPDSVTTLGNNAFAYCAKLTDVAFPANLQRIGSDAFDYACTVEGTYFYNLPDHIATLDWTPFSECGAVPCFNRGSDTATLFRSNNNTSSIWYTYAGETDFRYKWYNNEGSEGHEERLMRYAGSAEAVEIPAHVWLIDDGAFRDNAAIKKVIVPEGVTRIGNNVFRDCANLTDVTFPSTLKDLYDNAFYGCGSAAQAAFRFDLPDGISEVRGNVFTNCPAILTCGVDSTTASVISHRDWSFARNDRPEELDFRYKWDYFNHVWSWGLYDYVGALTSVRLPDDCPNVDSAVLRTKINNGLELVVGQLSDTAQGLSKAELTFTFPGHEGIRYRIFDDVLYLMGYVGTDTELIIPQAAEWIAAGRDEQVRQGCFTNLTALTRLALPEGVTRLNDDAFSGCVNLTDITLPDSLKSMGQKVFRYAGQNQDEPFYLTLPDYMEDLVGRNGGANSFEDLNAVLECGKTSQTAAVVTDRNYCYTVAGEHDFRYRYISYTEGEETGRRVWLVGYEGSPASSGVIGAGQIGQAVVGSDGGVVIPSGIYGIRRFSGNTTDSNWHTFHGDGFYHNEEVTRVVIPEGTVVIEDSAFRGCVNLTDITFPSTLKVFKNHAIQECGSASDTRHYYVLPDNMEEIATNTANDWGSMNDLNKGVIVCTAGSETARLVSNVYTNHYNGAYFFALKGHETDGLIYRYERYDTNVEGEYDYRLSLWRYDGDDIEVAIPSDSGLWRIENNVFKDKNNLQKVVIPEGVTEIGDSAFDGCAMLHEGEDQNVIVIPSGVKRAGNLAFKDLGNAYTGQRFFLVLPASLSEFNINIFTGCNAVLVAPAGSPVASALYNNWYYYYNTLEDAIAQANVQYQHYYVDGVEQEHVRYGKR